jgi:hypothetical protein
MTFFEKLMKGETSPHHIHDYIDTWHTKPNIMIPLHQYLGMSWKEFGRWVQLDATLETLVEERKNGKPVDMMTNEELLCALPVTSREDVLIELGARLGPGDED